MVRRVVALLGAVLVASNVHSEVFEPSTLTSDDACDECSLSLRQLRGQQELKPISKHTDPEDEESSEEDEEKPASKKAKATKSFTAPGFCCQDGALGDVCNGCFEQSIVAQGDFCSTEDKCSGKCGGQWCKATCVMAGKEANDWCMSAYPMAIANSSNICSKSAKNCAACSGQWCQQVATFDGSPIPGSEKKKAPKVNGFCCYGDAGASDVCGSCSEKAIAKNWNCARSKDACSICQGTWCSSNTISAPAKVSPAAVSPAKVAATTTTKPEQEETAEAEQPDDSKENPFEEENVAKVAAMKVSSATGKGSA